MKFRNWLMKENYGVIKFPVYHGGNWAGKNPIKTTGKGALGTGAYFTTDILKAKYYALESKGTVSQAILHINNPIIINYSKHHPQHPCVMALVVLGMSENKASDMVEKIEEQYGYIGKQISSRAMVQGYDGILEYFDNKLEEIVIWKSSQALFVKNII